MTTPPDFDQIALEWLATYTGHVPQGREKKLGDVLRKAYEDGKQAEDPTWGVVCPTCNGSGRVK